MKNMKTTLSVKVVSAALVLFLTGCDKEEDKKVTLSAIEVTPAQVELTVGGAPQQLTATPVPEEAEDVVFIWSSANDAVATVSQTGLVTAVSAGNTSVKVAGSGIEKSVPVAVVAAFVPALAVAPAAPEQVPEEGGILAFTVTANAAWTYSLSAGAETWLTETVKTASALTLTAVSNATVEAKNATITFSLVDYPGETQEVVVSQASSIIAQMNEEDFGAGVTPVVHNASAANLETTIEGITEPGNYVVNIAENVTLSEAGESGSNIVCITPGVVISLRGNGSSTLTPANDAAILRVEEGKVILRDITLSKTGNKMPAAYITANGILEINNGVSIVGAGESTNCGVDVNGGHLLMKGGEIHGHRRSGGGGAAYLHANGTFRMDGGKIYDNTAGYGGGVLIIEGNFIMNGGELYDNRSTDNSEGGGAVYLWAKNNHFEIYPGAVIYGKDGDGGSKAGNTAPHSGDTYGHAVTVFISGGATWKYRSDTIQNETLSITTNSAGTEISEQSGTWN